MVSAVHERALCSARLWEIEPGSRPDSQGRARSPRVSGRVLGVGARGVFPGSHGHGGPWVLSRLAGRSVGVRVFTHTSHERVEKTGTGQRWVSGKWRVAGQRGREAPSRVSAAEGGVPRAQRAAARAWPPRSAPRCWALVLPCWRLWRAAVPQRSHCPASRVLSLPTNVQNVGAKTRRNQTCARHLWGGQAAALYAF